MSQRAKGETKFGPQFGVVLVSPDEPTNERVYELVNQKLQEAGLAGQVKVRVMAV